MRREHASQVTRVNIFTHNGAPQALVGCLGRQRDAAGSPLSSRSGRNDHLPDTRNVQGTSIAERPPLRSVRAGFPHTAPTSGV
jgi:hypothetical protein